MLDIDNTYYIADKTGSITAYGDADPGDPASPIALKGTFQLPEPVTGLTVGMNLTFDGWLIVPTEHGYVVAVSRDFEEHRVARLRHAEGAEERATGPTGYGWVRNGVAIDSAGGLYVEVSSPSCVPIVSYPSDRVYLIGARDDLWTLEALEWSDGRSAFHTVIGGQRYNPLFSGTQIDEAGRIHYGTPWGRVRLAPKDQTAAEND